MIAVAGRAPARCAASGPDAAIVGGFRDGACEARASSCAATGCAQEGAGGRTSSATSTCSAALAALARAGPASWVVELGAGLGHLTRRLAATGAQVIAVERDRDLAPVLREELPGRGGGRGRREELRPARRCRARRATGGGVRQPAVPPQLADPLPRAGPARVGAPRGAPAAARGGGAASPPRRAAGTTGCSRCCCSTSPRRSWRSRFPGMRSRRRPRWRAPRWSWSSWRSRAPRSATRPASATW